MAKYIEWLTPEGLILVEGWARDGLIDEQIAKNMNVAYSTFREWKKKFPTLSAALKQGKEVSDRQVENALFKTATGYYYQEETVTNAGEIVTIKKYSKPNTTAQIFWLKNRKAEWTDRVDINAQVETKNKFDDIVTQLGNHGEGLVD